MSQLRLLSVAAAALGVSLAATGCASSQTTAADLSIADPTDVLLTTQMPVTVLDEGSGAELCVGGVAESYPPQCGGLTLVGWSWEEREGDYEEASGVRWGDFTVTGTYDAGAGTFTPTKVRSGADDVEPGLEGTDFSTPCAAPKEGWQVLDTETATEEALQNVFTAAAELEGYAGVWMDQSPNPAATATPSSPEEQELAMNDPLLTIVNVRVTGDTADAEAELRTVWGGMLCVTQARHTEAELAEIQDELHREVEGILGSHTDAVQGHVAVDVIYDDGALQDQVDETYGEGLVQVISLLVPAS